MEVALPPITDGRRQDATVTVPITFPALAGQQIQVTFTGVRAREDEELLLPQPDHACPSASPSSGSPASTRATPPAPAQMPGTCQANLLTIDGHAGAGPDHGYDGRRRSTGTR